ncbi:kinase [Defluviimonas sp. 20V17]|uniref:Kinase n=1 Tax=Allgaiera indica TaxID=765699 RepID=A0AAN4UNA5_9RHOB|nr:bifunctional aminoglycoside phosphotransferase/ATP-binding protein [Allgaiera indica]KDB03593.1 kinase [Defluviimonas sp. 20V17]GHD98324.1 kinase [Allgaiera indica]SDW49467.1 hypothetical protein SAMN05444006_10476 [Allgaiera indica]
MNGQDETLAFLGSRAAFMAAPGSAAVERIDTHGAVVFLHGDAALKIKRAVHYDYMDLSTPEQRRKMLQRELDLNAPAAPMIYHDLQPVTRGPDGALRIGGKGVALDWVLRMHRFAAKDELEAIAGRGALDDTLAEAIGRMVHGYHAAAPLRPGRGFELLGDILQELSRVFAGLGQGAPDITAWLSDAGAKLRDVAPLLDRRAKQGQVRRCHGDLHLRNIVVIEGRPVPFDALEFSEDLGTCDVLYDLAFLLMDLCHRGLSRAAARVLSTYLAAANGAQDHGLAALPLFLSVRAAIRAMVLLQTDAATAQPGRSGPEIAAYLREARAYLRPAPPRLVAIGGYSGTGKSLLAHALAPYLGPAPGAVVLSTDETRKIAPDLGPAAALPAKAYSDGARAAVYDRMLARAGVLIGAGHSVILDATWLDPARRRAAMALAARLHVPAAGLLLTAPPKVLRRRIKARRGDWSDADVAVLEGQLARGAGGADWTRIEAGGTPEATLAAARARLGNPPDGPNSDP